MADRLPGNVAGPARPADDPSGPGRGQWNYREGNRDWGYANNYGAHQDNAYQDPEWRSQGRVDYDLQRRLRRQLRDERAVWSQPPQAPRQAPWQVPGPHTGRGPRGYRRADGIILEDVSFRLEQHGLIDASDIEVTVEDGQVTLAGMIATRRQKRLAEDVAASVPGVADVHNRLRVQAA